MAIKIDRKIVKYSVQKPEEKQQKAEERQQKADERQAQRALEAKQPAVESETVRDRNGHMAKVIRMHEKLERRKSDRLDHKDQDMISDHAMYVTINDIVLNQAPVRAAPPVQCSSNREPRPFQWIVALTHRNGLGRRRRPFPGG
jgi:hypothetical protein